MNYVYTFSEINYGRIQIETAHAPDDGQIIEKILEGEADYNNTDFVDFRLIELDGVIQSDELEGSDKSSAWEKYLRYLRGWADSHGEPGFYGMTPAGFDEWHENEYQEECCLLNGDTANDCGGCIHGSDYHFHDGECMSRDLNTAKIPVAREAS